jgi:chromatin remodeling complex protein RSC6
MAPKKQTTTVEATPAPAPVKATKATKAAPAKAEKPAKVEKATKAAPVKETPVKAAKAEKPAKVEKAPKAESTEPKVRRKASKETVDDDMGSLTARLDEEIERLENKRKTEKNSSKSTGIQFLKQLRKSVKVLHRDASKVLKIRKINRPANDLSGFKKPVKVSDEIVKFFGWDSSKLYSRTDVTRAVCKYIRDNNLQDPENKRIIRPDAKLTTLLAYDPKTMPVDKKTGKPSPLFYYFLQKLLTRHFPAPVAK